MCKGREGRLLIGTPAPPPANPGGDEEKRESGKRKEGKKEKEKIKERQKRESESCGKDGEAIVPKHT